MTRSFNSKLNKMQQDLKANFERPTGQMILVKDFQQGSDQMEESESQMTVKMQKRASKEPARQHQNKPKKKPSIVPSKNLVMSV